MPREKPVRVATWNANKRGWWHDCPERSKAEYADVIELEADASYIRTWRPLFLHGLLQTDDYVRTLCQSKLTVYTPGMIEKGVTLETRRWSGSQRSPRRCPPPTYTETSLDTS